MTSEKVVFFCFWELSVFVFQLGIMTFKATKTWGKTAQLIQLFSLGVKNNRLNQLSNIKQTVRSSLEILHIYIYINMMAEKKSAGASLLVDPKKTCLSDMLQLIYALKTLENEHFEPNNGGVWVRWFSFSKKADF